MYSVPVQCSELGRPVTVAGCVTARICATVGVSAIGRVSCRGVREATCPERRAPDVATVGTGNPSIL
jgi:hypothetical protein